MLNVNDYKELLIERQEKRYLIRCVDNHNRVSWLEFDKEDDKRKIIDLIYSFLKNGFINGFNNLVSTHNHSLNNSVSDIFFCNGEKKISLKNCTQEFREINNFVFDKYTTNRDSFFKTEDINNIMVNASSSGRNFLIKDNVVTLTLNADLNMNILGAEREFVREFLQEKCGNRKINIEFIKGKNGMNESCIATCGEFKMMFPIGYTYSTIVGIINDHNYQVIETRKRR